MRKSYRETEIRRLTVKLVKLEQEAAATAKKLDILTRPHPEKPEGPLRKRSWESINTLGLPDKLIYILENNSREAFGTRITSIDHIYELNYDGCDWHRLEGFDKKAADILTEMMQFAGFKDFYIEW